MQFKCSWLSTISYLAKRLEGSPGDGLRSHWNYFLPLFYCSSRNAWCCLPDNAVYSRGKLCTPVAHCWSNADIQAEKVCHWCNTGFPEWASGWKQSAFLILSASSLEIIPNCKHLWEPYGSLHPVMCPTVNLQQCGYFKGSYFFEDLRGLRKWGLSRMGDGQIIFA